jgi:methylglutaconyl-CoA hydratase
MPEPLVIVGHDGPVTTLTLNRPAARNALSRGLVAALGDALEEAESRGSTRIVVLAAAGPAFCAGMDLKEGAAAHAGDEAAERRAVGDAQAIGDVLDRLHTLGKPAIAAVQGDAYGGGAGLVLACDYAVMSASASIGFPEVRRGLAACMVLHDLVRHAGDRRARGLLLTGEPIGAAVARDWGLVNAVTDGDVLAEARRVALAMARGGPVALATTKRLLDEATQRPRTLRGAAAVTAALRVSEEGAEGILAFAEKRPPAWAPPGSE